MPDHMKQRDRVARSFTGALNGIFAEVVGRVRRIPKERLAPASILEIVYDIREPMQQAIVNGTQAGAYLGVAAGGDILEDFLLADIIDDAKELLANEHAARWASNRSGTLIREVEDVHVKAIRRLLEQNIQAGGNSDTLANMLFGKIPGRHGVLSGYRAKRIAVSETTASYAEGNMQIWRASEVVEGVGWRTGNDEIVCPVCAPLGGLKWRKTTTGPGMPSPASIEKQKKNAVTASLENPVFKHPGGRGILRKFSREEYRRPPAHPSCRCGLVPIVEGVMADIRSQYDPARLIEIRQAVLQRIRKGK